MKKLLIAFLLVFPLLSFLGCGQKNAESLMSEQTRIVFAGNGNCGQCLVSVGERENPYIIDGAHGQITGFSLIVFKPSYEVEEVTVKLSVEIDGKRQDVLMELNPINMTFVADLGYCIAESAVLNVYFQDEIIQMENISDGFSIDYSQAIKLGIQKVEESESFSDEEYECYLKLLEGERFGQEGYFWCFSVVSSTRESKNVLISTLSGKIILG